MKKRHVVHSFPLIKDKESKILILGSVPSVKSVDLGFYYMHPQNRFWKVLDILFEENFYESDIIEKTRLLIKHHISLYDAAKECDILGSSDSKITNIVPTNIQEIVKDTNIMKIYCNGKRSFQIAKKTNPEFDIVDLPSTSPANAAWNLEKLVEKWKIILE